MPTQSSWIHGVAVKPEFVGDEYFKPVQYNGTKFANTELVGLPQGPGGTWRGVAGTTSWFHVALPTPSGLDGAQASLTKITVSFAADDGVSVGNVHAWDGPNKFLMLHDLDLRGTQNGTPGNEPAVFPLDEPQPLNYGLIVSVGVTFEKEGDLQLSGIGGEFSF
jgi:hypothetical protein